MPDLQINAADEVARALTPSLGYSTSSPPDRLVARAQQCVREA